MQPCPTLVRQVKQALRFWLLQAGDHVRTLREIVAGLAISPNTVLKAFRELEHEEYVASLPGQGIFVSKRPDPTKV